MLSMLSLEKLANANIKNRAEYTQLSTELSRLEKEKQNELRMFNNEIQRFKARYSKTNFNTDSPEASKVKMYETHNPGFCYKRNGEHRVMQVLEQTPSVDFKHLHFLLFTNGEVDIEKILCLHLLSSHETDHLTPPRRPRTSGFLKKDSPLEQLIERSKENPKEAVLEAILPTYVLDVSNKQNKRSLMDERLSARLIINEKILELIMTVITALESSNPEKVQQLVGIAEDPSRIKRIFRKQHIQDFVMILKDHSLVNSCSSFILTQPDKIKTNHIEIKTPSGALEDLVCYIRSNVLQFPKRKSYNLLENESKELVTIEHLPIDQKISSFSAMKVEPSFTSKRDKKREDFFPEPSRFRRNSTNFVQKNIEKAASYRRDLEEREVKPRQRNSIDSEKKSKRSSISTSSRTFSSESQRTKLKHNHQDVRVHSKQTTCPACMERWKTPLPSPKVSKYTKRPSSSSSENKSSEQVVLKPILKTDSVRRLNNLIEKEEFTLNSYDRKYSNASNVSAQSKKRTSVLQDNSLDLVALNIFDLEKIRHEIRDKETQKKLEKFLDA